jgi:hypothetical protein
MPGFIGRIAPLRCIRSRTTMANAELIIQNSALVSG